MTTDLFELLETNTPLDAGECAVENRTERMLRILSGDLGNVVTTANVMFDDRNHAEAQQRARADATDTPRMGSRLKTR